MIGAQKSQKIGCKETTSIDSKDSWGTGPLGFQILVLIYFYLLRLKLPKNSGPKFWTQEIKKLNSAQKSKK